jgi:hypothetical protein
MKNRLIRILAILIMIPIMCIGIIVSILWNSYLIGNYIWVRFRRKTIAGIKEAQKTDGQK